jgi:hypothetical protein
MSNPDLDKLLADHTAKMAAMTPDARSAYYAQLAADQIAHMKANPYTGGERQAQAMRPKMTNENDLIRRGDALGFCGVTKRVGPADEMPRLQRIGYEQACGCIAEYIAALPAAPMGVKPLEWRGAESDCFAEALVGEGCYQLTVSDSLERPCDYAWVAEYSENGRNPFTIIGHGSFADVVQIANQHRSARILSALTPQPAPTLREALELPEIKALVEAVDAIDRSYETEYDGRMYHYCTGCNACLSEGIPHEKSCAWVTVDTALAALQTKGGA